MQRDVMKIIANGNSKINAHYEMTTGDMHKIRDNSQDLFFAVANAFTFGYIQGSKAAKRETAKKKAGQK